MIKSINFSFDSEELDKTLINMYYSIKESAKNVALLHVDTIKTNNEHHFGHFIEDINLSINKLKEFYPITDKRRDFFIPLNKEELIKEAKDFFEQDLY